jgi:hypothetical protein
METDMTKFVRDQFSYWGGYLTYGPERLFIARFKYASTSSKPRWTTFMIKNFTVEEWQAARAQDKAPLDIMRSKGFELTHILKWRREGVI